MHVLVIPSYIPTDIKPNAGGNFIKLQVSAIKKYLNIEIGVIYPCFLSKAEILENFSSLKPQIIKYNYDGVFYQVLYSYAWVPRRPHGTFRQWIKSGLKLYDNYIEQFGKPDLIHAHFALNAGYLAYKINQKYKMPFIITEHWSAYARKTLKHWQIKKILTTLSKVEKLIIVSPHFKKLLIELFPNISNKTIYIPNMVDTEFFSIKSLPYKKKDTFKFVCISELTYNKGLQNLILALSELINLNVSLTIIGDGPEKYYLVNLIRSLKIEKYIKLLGHLDPNDVKTNIQDSHALVHSSLSETFGIVVIEALSCGKPVVVTRCGGPEHIINDKNGILVKKDDVLDLARGMKQIIKNYHNYSAEWIHNNVEHEFSVHTVTKNIVDIYNQTLENI